MPHAIGPVLQAGQVRERGDRFACLPLHAKLTAGVCADRQALAHSTERGPTSASGGWMPKRSDAYAVCRDCALGRVVAARLKGGSTLAGEVTA